MEQGYSQMVPIFMGGNSDFAFWWLQVNLAKSNWCLQKFLSRNVSSKYNRSGLWWNLWIAEYYFKGLNFRGYKLSQFCKFFLAIAKVYTREIVFSVPFMKVNPRNFTLEVTRKILIKNAEKWSILAWKSENLAKISRNRESLYPRNIWMGPFAKGYTRES